MAALTLLYLICALLLALYTLGHGVLLLQYIRQRRHPLPSPEPLTTWPSVTVQLPVYNEWTLALRLLDAVAALDYPPDKLTIQLLDDSSDGTARLLADARRHYPHLTIQHVRRQRRSEYKAGALAHGLSRTDAPFIAIFDADFVPPADFLRRTLPYLLADTGLAFVQTRWDHLNPDLNWLTGAQVLAVDMHFTVEQDARNRSGWFLPFNGTGGVWRRAAIDDAGGWSGRTLTEDLDLSFRAQLKGWRARYLAQVAVPAELPQQLSAYRQQQGRWARGSAQCLRLLSPALWRSDSSWMTRWMASHHLAQYLPHLLMFVMQILTPILLVTDALPDALLAPLGLVSLIPLLMVAVSQWDLRGGWRGLRAFPALLLLGTGLAAHHAAAVIGGLLHNAGEFRRTPKSADLQALPSAGRRALWTALDGLLGLYALWGVSVALTSVPALVPYLGLNALAYLLIAVHDLRDQWRGARQTRSTRLMPDSGSD